MPLKTDPLWAYGTWTHSMLKYVQPFAYNSGYVFGGSRGDGVAQLVERQTPHFIIWVHIPSGAQEKLNEFFWVKHVVLTRCLCAQPLCVHTRIRMITYVRTLNIRVRVWWITETPKDQACTWNMTLMVKFLKQKSLFREIDRNRIALFNHNTSQTVCFIHS